MKKILITALAIVCLVCVGLAAACTSGDPEYFTLTITTDDGVRVISDAPSGSKVPKGYVIDFTVEKLEGAEGEPVVTINGNTANANDDGVYSFTMTGDTTVSVTGVYLLSDYKITFDTKSNDFVKFTTVDGEELTTLEASSGTTVNFKVWLSVYYDNSDFSVTANSQILNDNDGVYSFVVTGDKKVTIEGLPEELASLTFLGREDGGDGTQENPFKIKKPVDLYGMASIIEDEFYQGSLLYQTAYYSLENDIDLQGEKLYIIGDSTTQLSIFAGFFDGNNHTISNYYMDDTIIEQSNGTTVHLPYVGLFGFAATGGIHNLNLENFTLEINATEDVNVFAGGLVGYGRGMDISNCTVNGNLIVYGYPAVTDFVGGIIGAQEAYYDETSDVHYYSFVRSCVSEVDILVASGFVYAGGITGYLSTYGNATTAAILNSYSTGDVMGAVRAGGIAGQVSSYGSIKNCYATGYIEATNQNSEYAGAEYYSNAYAGGIAAYAEYGSVISNCFFTGETSANAVSGSSYESADGIVAGIDDPEPMYSGTEGTVVVFCYSASSSKYSDVTASGVTDALLKNTLGWTEADWTFTGNGNPEINRDEATITFTVTVKKVDGTVVYSFDITDQYIPMSYWYADGEKGIPEYLGEGNRSYGYYFDEELTNKVTYGYVPTTDVTLYAGYADYSKVAGEYYFTNADGNREYIILDENGVFTYRNGACEYTDLYTFDGNFIVLRPCPATEVEVSTISGESVVTVNYYVSSKAAYEEGKTDYVFEFKYIDVLNSINETFTAVKKVSGFSYGSYYGENGSKYEFFVNHTGEMTTADGAVTSFTYSIGEGTISVNMGANYTGKTENGVVTELNGVALTQLDTFAGVWEKSASSKKQYTFDGLGGWKYEYFGYNTNGEKVVIDSANGNYTVQGNVLTLDNGVEVTLKDGLLSISGETYYQQNSFAGVWKFAGKPSPNDPITVEFKGIGSDGVGKAEVTYFPSYYGSIELTYEAVTDSDGNVTVVLYDMSDEFGRLTYDTATKTFSGSIYSAVIEGMNENVLFCLYDDFGGRWYNDDLGTVIFNGYGNYDISGTENYLPTAGKVAIGGKTVQYSLKNGTLTGSFEYNGETYEIEFNETDKTVTVTCGDDVYILTSETSSAN